jgi:hypothetical protein
MTMLARLDIEPQGCFISEAAMVGATEQEVWAMGMGILPELRAEQIRTRLREEAYTLARRWPMGQC